MIIAAFDIIQNKLKELIIPHLAKTLNIALDDLVVIDSARALSAFDRPPSTFLLYQGFTEVEIPNKETANTKHTLSGFNGLVSFTLSYKYRHEDEEERHKERVRFGACIDFLTVAAKTNPLDYCFSDEELEIYKENFFPIFGKRYYLEQVGVDVNPVEFSEELSACEVKLKLGVRRHPNDDYMHLDYGRLPLFALDQLEQGEEQEEQEQAPQQEQEPTATEEQHKQQATKE